jgi:hypothetical protein
MTEGMLAFPVLLYTFGIRNWKLEQLKRDSNAAVGKC